MVERSLSMREVAGSMPASSNPRFVLALCFHINLEPTHVVSRSKLGKIILTKKLRATYFLFPI